MSQLQSKLLIIIELSITCSRPKRLIKEHKNKHFGEFFLFGLKWIKEVLCSSFYIFFKILIISL